MSRPPCEDVKARTSGCFSMVAAWLPILALSILAVTTSNRSSALSIPVAAKLSTSSVAPPFLLELSVETEGAPPAAMAPGPAGFALAPAEDFFPPAFGEAFFVLRDASSSANRRAFSALRASSALRFSSRSSLPLVALAPSSHLAASAFS